MNADRWPDDELAALAEAGLLRTLRPLPDSGGRVGEWLSFASNDYLDLAHHPHVVECSAAALRRYGAGSGASRLVAGTLELHEQLEARLAAHKGYPSALVVGSGYLAGVALPLALVERGDRVLSDRLVHASLLDGAVRSRANHQRFKHNDVDHLRQLLAAGGGRRVLVLTESVFSMDGDLAPLPELAAACAEYGALLLVDEAHAAGLFGPNGGGRVRELGLTEQVTVSLSTLSKALGGYGGVLASAANVRSWLINKHRGLIYSTALPPAVVGAALGAMDVLAAEPDRGSRVLALAEALRQRLHAAGLFTFGSASAIVPVLVGDARRTVEVAQRLLERGFLVGAIRPPTVPAGTARLRLSVTLAHSAEDVDGLADAVIAEVGA